MLLRKQTAYHQTFTANLSFAPSRVGYEAGIVLWWNQFSYATVGVTLGELSGGTTATTIVRRSPMGQAGVINVCEMCSEACKTTAYRNLDLVPLLEQRGASGKGGGGT